MAVSSASANKTRRSPLIWGLWVVAAVVGGMGLFQRFFHGDQGVDFSSYVPWGLWVVAYIYFSGLSAGAFLIAAAAYTLKIKALQPIARMCLLVAMVCLIMGIMAVGLDLGHMERTLLVFIRPQFHSMMAWMVWLYTVYFILLVFMLSRASKEARGGASADHEQKALGKLGLIGIFLALGFAGGAGALFATVSAREFWHTSLYPIFFMVGALTSGAALVTAFTAWAWPVRNAAWQETVTMLGRIVRALVVIELVLGAAEYLIPAWYGVGPAYDLTKHVLFGPHWYVFWVFSLLLGVVVPLVLLSGKRSPGGIGLAAALVAVMFFAVRLNLVIPGLITPQIQGLGEAYTDPVGGKLSFLYMPTWFEWQVMVGIIAVGVALWYLGTRLLPWVLPSSSSQSSEVRS